MDELSKLSNTPPFKDLRKEFLTSRNQPNRLDSKIDMTGGGDGHENITTLLLELKMEWMKRLIVVLLGVLLIFLLSCVTQINKNIFVAKPLAY